MSNNELRHANKTIRELQKKLKDIVDNFVMVDKFVYKNMRNSLVYADKNLYKFFTTVDAIVALSFDWSVPYLNEPVTVHASFMRLNSTPEDFFISKDDNYIKEDWR